MALLLMGMLLVAMAMASDSSDDEGIPQLIRYGVQRSGPSDFDRMLEAHNSGRSPSPNSISEEPVTRRRIRRSPTSRQLSDMVYESDYAMNRLMDDDIQVFSRLRSGLDDLIATVQDMSFTCDDRHRAVTLLRELRHRINRIYARHEDPEELIRVYNQVVRVCNPLAFPSQ